MVAAAPSRSSAIPVPSRVAITTISSSKGAGGAASAAGERQIEAPARARVMRAVCGVMAVVSVPGRDHGGHDPLPRTSVAQGRTHAARGHPRHGWWRGRRTLSVARRPPPSSSTSPERVSAPGHPLDRARATLARAGFLACGSMRARPPSRATGPSGVPPGGDMDGRARRLQLQGQPRPGGMGPSTAFPIKPLQALARAILVARRAARCKGHADVIALHTGRLWALSSAADDLQMTSGRWWGPATGTQ